MTVDIRWIAFVVCVLAVGGRRLADPRPRRALAIALASGGLLYLVLHLDR